MSWRNLLDVVNSGKFYDEIIDGIYVCPNTPGSYNHKRAKYLGAYRNKTVSMIAEIKAVVIVRKERKSAVVKWNNSIEDEKLLILEAVKKLEHSPYPARIRESNERDLQVFLLSNQAITDFKKESKGGMFGSKQYFFLPQNIETSVVAARFLFGKNWGDL